MKLSEELKLSGKVLTSKGFTEEGKLLTKIADNKLEAFVLVSENIESEASVVQDAKSIFLDKAKAEEAIKAATCKYMRDNHRYLYYALDAANNRNKKRSEAEVAKKASAIFGTNMQFSSEKFKLPKNATDQQLIEFSAYLGYTPIVLQKIKLEV